MKASAKPRMRASSTGGSVLLVANYESNVGYAWWLMEEFWCVIAQEMAAQNRKCILAYPVINQLPAKIARARLDIRQIRVHWSFSMAVLRLLRRERVRTVYITDWPYVHWIYLVWRLVGVRRVVLHDHKPGDRPRANWLKRVALGCVHASNLMACTCYVGVSRYIGRRLQESACVPARRCRVVENGIEMFDERAERDAYRKALDIPDSAVLVVMVSRATTYKGLDFALTCFDYLRADLRCWPEIRVVHCGDGPDLQRFRAQALGDRLSPQVTFLGRRTDVRKILSAADVAFHPSRGEGLSLAILEFMCARLPVVVPDLPSVCAPVVDKVNGFIYRHDSIEEAGAALARLVSDRALRERMGEAGRAAVAARYTLEHARDSFVREAIPEF